MLSHRLLTLASLLLLTALLVPAGTTVAREDTCLEDSCEIVVDPIDCFQGSEKVLHVNAKRVIVEIHYACSNGAETSDAPAGCDDHPSPTAIDVEIEDACYRAEPFPNSACLYGGWEATYGSEDVQVTVRGCDVPFDPEISSGPTASSADGRCEGWSYGVTDALPGPIAIQDDGCLVVVQDPPYQCVGPWGTSVEGDLGPVAYDWYVCTPPGQPVEIA